MKFKSRDRKASALTILPRIGLISGLFYQVADGPARTLTKQLHVSHHSLTEFSKDIFGWIVGSPEWTMILLMAGRRAGDCISRVLRVRCTHNMLEVERTAGQHGGFLFPDRRSSQRSQPREVTRRCPGQSLISCNVKSSPAVFLWPACRIAVTNTEQDDNGEVASAARKSLYLRFAKSEQERASASDALAFCFWIRESLARFDGSSPLILKGLESFAWARVASHVKPAWALKMKIAARYAAAGLT
jgi:hypothetical protein